MRGSLVGTGRGVALVPEPFFASEAVGLVATDAEGSAGGGYVMVTAQARISSGVGTRAFPEADALSPSGRVPCDREDPDVVCGRSARVTSGRLSIGSRFVSVNLDRRLHFLQARGKSRGGCRRRVRILSTRRRVTATAIACLTMTALLAACTRIVEVPVPAAAASSPSPTASPTFAAGASHTCTLPRDVVTNVVGLGPNPLVKFGPEEGKAQQPGMAECRWSSTGFTVTNHTMVTIDYGSIAGSKVPVTDGLGEAKVNLCVGNDKIYAGAIPNSFVCGFIAIPPNQSRFRSALVNSVMVSGSQICYITYGYAGTGSLDSSWAVDIVKQLQAGLLPYLDA
jgi:hypothetical protein